LKNAY